MTRDTSARMAVLDGPQGCWGPLTRRSLGMITGRVAAMRWSGKKAIVAMACWRFFLPGDAQASVIGCQVGAGVGISGALCGLPRSGRGLEGRRRWPTADRGPDHSGRRRDPVPHGTRRQSRLRASSQSNPRIYVQFGTVGREGVYGVGDSPVTRGPRPSSATDRRSSAGVRPVGRRSCGASPELR